MAEAVLNKGFSLKIWQRWSLLLAVIIYALWGTPTPDRAEWPEIVIGLLLISAVGLPQAVQALLFNQGEAWERAGKALLVYGLTLPVFTGLLSGNNIIAIARDIVPFLFLLLPVFLYPLWRERAHDIRHLTGVIILLGLVFALRVILPALAASAPLALTALPDPFLLANAPTVLFAALLLGGGCGVYLYHGDLFKSALCLALALIPLVTMALIGQRASIGVFILAVLFLAGLGFVRRPLRLILPGALLLLAVAIYWPVIAAVIQSLMHKTSLVGFNMRWQEAQAVMEALHGSVLSVLFGKGWGATVASPAVGGEVVNFTHSLLTTYWLKTGLFGLALALLYLFRLGVLLLEMLWRYPVMALALAGPFLIDILLYASFKSLGFGLILLLIPLWYSVKRLDPSPDSL